MKKSDVRLFEYELNKQEIMSIDAFASEFSPHAIDTLVDKYKDIPKIVALSKGDMVEFYTTIESFGDMHYQWSSYLLGEELDDETIEKLIKESLLSCQCCWDNEIDLLQGEYNIESLNSGDEFLSEGGGIFESKWDIEKSAYYDKEPLDGDPNSFHIEIKSYDDSTGDESTFLSCKFALVSDYDEGDAYSGDVYGAYVDAQDNYLINLNIESDVYEMPMLVLEECTFDEKLSQKLSAREKGEAILTAIKSCIPELLFNESEGLIYLYLKEKEAEAFDTVINSSSCMNFDKYRMVGNRSGSKTIDNKWHTYVMTVKRE